MSLVMSLEANVLLIEFGDRYFGQLGVDSGSTPSNGRVSKNLQPFDFIGWGGRDRTSAWGNQNPLPYRLATPQ